METRISSKGQITLPVDVRKILRIKTGDVLTVKIAEEGAIVLKKFNSEEKNAVKSLEVLHKTAGIWRQMEESGEDYVRRLRASDSERLKVLGID